MKKKVNTNLTKKKIFLSHSGKDKKYLKGFIEELNAFLHGELDSVSIEIFNTDDLRYRFKDLKETIATGSDFKKETSKWEKELTEYLRTNLLNSDIYLLLATKKTFLENSEWISFEIKTAEKEAKQKGRPVFIPCLYKGSSFTKLPQKAMQFQGADLNSDEGFLVLARDISIRLTSHL